MTCDERRTEQVPAATKFMDVLFHRGISGRVWMASSSAGAAGAASARADGRRRCAVAALGSAAPTRYTQYYDSTVAV